MFQQRSYVVLDLLQLVELQFRIGDREEVTRAGLLIDENALAIANNLLLHFEQPLSFQHDRKNVTRGHVVWIIDFDELAEKRFGGFLLNRIAHLRRRFVNTLPIGDEAFALARAVTVLLLPASLANVGAAKLRFVVK